MTFPMPPLSAVPASSAINGYGAPGGPSLDHPGYVVGRYYTGFPATTAPSWSTKSTSAQDVMTFSPVFLPARMSIDRLGFYAGNTGTGNIRCGLYSNLASQPSSLIADAGSIAGTGGAGLVVGTVSITLPRGWYWFAVLPDLTAGGGTMTLYGISLGAALAPIIEAGFLAPSTLGTTTAGTNVCYTASQTFGALPATPPALSATTDYFRAHMRAA